MLGVFHELGLEDLGSFQGRRKGLVGRLLRGGQIDRVENLRLIIVGEAPGHDLEGVGEGLHARAVRTLIELVIVFRDCLDVESLALGFGADCAPARNGFLGFLRFFRRWSDAEGISNQNSGDAPCGDRAIRIVL